MQILIVEDELLIAEMLKEMLLDLNHQVVDIADSYNDAITALENNTNIEFCFLDINLNCEKTGMDIAKTINQRFLIPYVFLTSYSDKQTIAKALEFKPQAYLIKPFTEIDLFTTLELVKNRIQHKEVYVEYAIIKDGNNTVKVLADDILWLKSDNVYVEIVTKAKRYLVRNSLGQILEDLGLKNIKRVHRAFAVNIKNINAISAQHIIIGSEKIPVSRMHKEEIMAIFS